MIIAVTMFASLCVWVGTSHLYRSNSSSVIVDSRIVRLLDGERISFGGEVDETDSYIAPTVVRDCKLDAAVMKQEVVTSLSPSPNTTASKIK